MATDTEGRKELKTRKGQKPWTIQKVRDRIRVTALVNRLEQHALGRTKMTPTQLRANQILLDRCLPSLTAMEYRGEVTQNVIHSEPSTADWLSRHTGHVIESTVDPVPVLEQSKLPALDSATPGLPSITLDKSKA